VLARQPRDYDLEAFRARVRAAREDERTVRLAVEVGDAARGLPRRSFGVAVARALMRVEPRLVESYAGFVGSREGGAGTEPCFALGADEITLRFQTPGLPLLGALVRDSARLEAVAGELRGWGRLVGLATEDEPEPERQWTIESPYPFVPREYLERQALTGTLRRLGTGHYAYEWSAKARRRDVLRALEWQARDGGALVTLRPGRRFDLEQLLATAFELPRRSDWVRLRACARELRPAPAGVPVS